MKKIILSMVFVFTSFAMVNANVSKLYTTNKDKSTTNLQFDNNQIIVRDCFSYAIAMLEAFEARYWTLSDSEGAYYMNEAYANCWLDEQQ